MSLGIIFWFDKDDPVMMEITRLDSLCARLWYEHQKFANLLRKTQKDNGTNRLSKPIGTICVSYASDKVLKYLSNSDQVLVHGLFKRSILPDHPDQEKNLRLNLAEAHFEYMKYDNLRKQQISLAEKAGLICNANMTYTYFELQVEPYARLLGFDSYQGWRDVTCGELQDSTHKPFNAAMLKSCIVNHLLAPPNKGIPFRVRFVSS